MTKKLNKLSPKQLEAIATKLTGLQPEVKLNEKIKADKNIHRRTLKGHDLSKTRKEG